jgi:hypothetical protein
MSTLLSVPEPYSEAAGRRREPPAVLRKGDGVGEACMPRECRLMSTHLGIPEPDGVIIGRRREPSAVMREGDGVDRACMPRECQ